MDFQFTASQGFITAKCSMEQIALANWFNTEMRSKNSTILAAFSACQNATSHQDILIEGSEYSLFINQYEVMVRANNLALNDAPIEEEDLHYYDAESIALCGLDDFLHFLNAYFEFIG